MPTQCAARAKSTGKQCKRLAHPGARVCVKHGAAAPQVLAAARRRREQQTALQWAAHELARSGTPERTPLEHLESVLEEDARTYALWAAAVALLTDEGEDLLGENRHGEAAIHPYVDERNKAAQRWARTSKYALDAGVSQKRVEIEQQRAELMAEALKATLSALGLSAELQQRGLSILGQQLRRLGPSDIEGQAA
jgi:hypothetical protein